MSPARGAAAAALAGVLLAGCGGGRAPDGGTPAGIEVPAGTPVVLVSIDTLRSDRLPAYGYGGVETPAIDAFASEAIVFEHAYSHVPLTLPAHASILTGLLPPEHGVRDNIGYRLETEGLPYLPQLLRGRGYRTGAFVSAFVMRGVSGLDEGFELYDDHIDFQSWIQMGSVQRSGPRTLEPALRWLGEVHGEPFFLFFHLYEPHTPYEPPEPFASRYESPYDAEVAAADRVVGELFAELKRLGVYDRSIVVLLSDHGEGLGEHGDLEHGPLLYREALQVPMMLRLPGGERGGRRVAAPAQLIDVLPTLAGLLELDVPAGLPGSSLLGLGGDDAPERTVYAETYFPRLHFGWSELTALIDFPHHFIYGPDPELYDLEQDPAQLEDLVEARELRGVTARLNRELQAVDQRFTPPAESDPETRRKLAALGYVGSAPAPAGGSLPDPKARIHSLDKARRAFGLFERGRLEEAIVAFREVVAEEPQMVDVWEHIGHAHLRLGDAESAIEAYRRALEVSGGAPHVALSAAGAFLRLGRLEEARDHALLALPLHPAAHDLLAQTYLELGELEAAERHVEEALAIRGTRTAPLVTQAEIRVAQERFEEAVELTRRAEREIAAREQAQQALGARRDLELYRGLYFVRGNAYARLGEAAEAEEAFRRAIELFPDELPAYTHLALLYALEGRGQEAAATLRQMLASNPDPEGYAEAVQALRVLGDPKSAQGLLRQGLERWPASRRLRQLAAG